MPTTLAIDDTTAAATETILAATAAAHPAWADTPAPRRAVILDRIAEALTTAADKLVPVAMAETNLPEGRLRGELKRTAFQLSLFGTVLREGGFLDARIDHADPEWPMGAARPDLRRSLRPLGPVLVFAASNFPFAFSVAGGDTASALAAGNAVIVKAHPGHPQLSQLTIEVLRTAIADAGADPDIVSLVFGTAAGATALTDRRIKAAGFTGSIAGGRALFDLANSRPDPIPFYGELGSANPVFVTRGAAEQRGKDIVTQFLSSYTLGTGQFCTKPGILFVPAGSNMSRQLAEAELPGVGPMLNQRIDDGFHRSLDALSTVDEVRVLNGTLGDETTPVLLATTIERLLAEPETLETECFGPAALIVEYTDEAELIAAAETFDGQLTATIQAEDSCDVAALVRVLVEKAGRLLWNEWPTGVSVTYSQQHGGPYPATTAPTTTSVGTAAIERFLRPVAYQNFPQHLLPAELRDENSTGALLTVDGTRSR